VVPVAADTTGGGNRLDSFSSACAGNVCTQTTVSAFLDPSAGGTACIDFFTYLAVDGTFVSDESGCAPAPSFNISSTLAASFGPTSIPLQLCDQTSCTATRTVIVSASDTPTGPITTTSGRSTTKDGTCTTKIKFTDRFVSVVGTYTIDGTATAETGNVSTHTETSKTTCRI
jgi:hypothetical protein